MGYKFKIIEMSKAEMKEALDRIKKKAPKGEWFMARDVRETRTVMDTLAAAGILDSSCVSRSAPYYKIKG